MYVSGLSFNLSVEIHNVNLQKYANKNNGNISVEVITVPMQSGGGEEGGEERREESLNQEERDHELLDEGDKAAEDSGAQEVEATFLLQPVSNFLALLLYRDIYFICCPDAALVR